MEFLGQMWANIMHFISYFGPFIAVLSVVVVVHEYGHYIVGKWCKVKVSEFSLGFGPELFGYTNKAGERWKVCAIPLGGYVKFYGDEDASSVPDEAALASMTKVEREQTLPGRPLVQRAAVVAAGPLANFILAIFIFFSIFSIVGKPLVQPVIGEVIIGGAAEKAGLQAGDRVLEIDSIPIKSFTQIQRQVLFFPDQQRLFKIDRNGVEIQLSVTPETKATKDSFGAPQRTGLIGIKASSTGKDTVFVQLPVGESFIEAVKETGFIIDRTLSFIGGLFAGTESAKQLGGPIRIAQASGEAASYGLTSTFQLIALLSVSIGLLNLFPIPMLDGGHLVMYFFEFIRGKPLSERIQNWSFKIGFAIVIALMIFSTLNDITLLSKFF